MNLPASKTKDNTIRVQLGAIGDLTQTFGVREATDILRLSSRAAVVERQWVKRADQAIAEATAKVIANARQTGRLSFADVDFEALFMEHAYRSMRAGIDSTETRTPIRYEQLAAPPPGRVPKSLKALREWWDKYRKTGKPTGRALAEALDLKREFLEQIQRAWRESSEDFLSGITARNTNAVNHIRKRARVAASRAKMIVETETTYYFNKARREVYGKSDDVTHFLFLAIRDHATTRWCKTRHGLVYAKGDPLLDKETPPCHWYCRSELIPLTPHNAKHLALIQDRARARRSNSPEPLPKGWTGSR